MKDEKYVFFEDVKEKSITARSSKKRPRHSGCRLPQYTAKEMREMSGPTYTLNLKKAIPYAEFKALPEDLQKEYIKNIVDRYRVGPTAIAELMGASPGTLGVYLNERGFSFKRGFRPAKEDLARFREDYQNHAGCERGYFITDNHKLIALPKHCGNDNHNLLIPDVIVRDDTNKVVYLIEGKKLETINAGLKEIEDYDDIEYLYLNKYFPEYTVRRYLTIYGGKLTQIPNNKVLLYLNDEGLLLINNDAEPELAQKINSIFSIVTV